MSNKSFVLKIGRNADNGTADIRIDDVSVSRVHAELFIDPDGRVFVTDLNSTNGTFVNSIPVKGTVQLRPGQTLKVGRKEINWEGEVEKYRRKIGTNGRGEVADPDISKSDSRNYYDSFEDKSKYKRKLKLIAGFVSVIIIACLALSYFFFLRNPDSGDNQEMSALSRQLSKADLEKMTYLQMLDKAKKDSLIQLTDLSNGEMVKSSDGKKVSVVLQDGYFAGIELVTDDPVPANEEKREKEKTKVVVLNNDKDNDGIVDKMDQCPDKAGPIENKGCPAKPPVVENPVADNKETSLGIITVMTLENESLAELISRVKLKPAQYGCNKVPDAESVAKFNSKNPGIPEKTRQEMTKNESAKLPPGLPIKLKCN